MKWNFDAETITAMVDTLIGNIEAYGSESIDKERYENQRLYCDVIEGLLDSIYHNTKFANRPESSMNKIGTYAKAFLGNLVEEYGLNDFAEHGLIHCKNCKSYDIPNEFCWKMLIEREEDDFCSRAKRKEE